LEAVVIAPWELNESTWRCTPEHAAVFVEDVETGEQWALGWRWFSDLETPAPEFQLGEPLQVTGQVTHHFGGSTQGFAVSDAEGLRYAASQDYGYGREASFPELYPGLSLAKGDPIGHRPRFGSCYAHYGMTLETPEGPLSLLPGDVQQIILDDVALELQVGTVAVPEGILGCQHRYPAVSWVVWR
jgi:hypothetical protein